MRELHVMILKTWKEKIKGLLFSDKATPVLIQTRWGIHTFGMRYPIDVLVLNKNNQIMKLAKELKPNRIFLWNPFFTTIIELPAGYIEKEKIKQGDVIEITIK